MSVTVPNDSSHQNCTSISVEKISANSESNRSLNSINLAAGNKSSPVKVASQLSKKSNRQWHKNQFRKMRQRKNKDYRPEYSSEFSKNLNFSVSCNFSNNMWFWENYKRAQEWQHSHFLAVSKATQSVRNFQNKILEPLKNSVKKNSQTFSHRNCLPMKSKRQHFHSSRTEMSVGEKYNELMGSLSSVEMDEFPNCIEEGEDENNSSDEIGFQFIVDENMIKFLEHSMKHKQEMQKLREAEGKSYVDTEMYEAPKESAASHRKKVMEFMYGDAAPKILSMEMAMQMSFDHHFDSKQPILWPNIPLIL